MTVSLTSLHRINNYGTFILRRQWQHPDLGDWSNDPVTTNKTQATLQHWRFKLQAWLHWHNSRDSLGPANSTTGLKPNIGEKEGQAARWRCKNSHIYQTWITQVSDQVEVPLLSDRDHLLQSWVVILISQKILWHMLTRIAWISIRNNWEQVSIGSIHYIVIYLGGNNKHF